MQGLHQLVAEKVVLGGITHADVGKWMCEQWGLPDEIGEIVGNHHSPFTTDMGSQELIIVHLADAISSNYYENLMGSNTDFIYSERIRESLGLSKQFISQLVKDMPHEIYKAEKYADVFF